MKARKLFQAVVAVVVCLLMTGCQFKWIEEYPRTLFEGDPRHQKEPLIGDKGFLSDCQFGDEPCALKTRVISGPFAREFDQRAEGIEDDATYRVTIYGRGVATIGATDYKMCKEKHFGFHQQVIPLTEEGVTFEFHWPGLTENSDGSLNGYGFEIMAMQAYEEDPVVITDIKLEIIGKGNLTEHERTICLLD